MNFRKTEDQELFIASLQEVVRRYGTEEYIKECDEKGEYPVKLMEALHEAGFDMLGVPEEYGGTPCDMQTLMMYHEEFARICSGAYACECVALAMADMIKFGSKEQIQDCVDSINELKTPFCLGFTEPQAGSDSGAITTSYTRKNGKIYLNGRKTFISRADIAGHMLCMAVNADGPDPVTGKKQFTTLWVPMDAPGIKVEPIPKVGWHMVHSCDVYLDNIELEGKDIVGVEGKGFVNVMKNFEIERIVMSATALGEATMAFEDAIVYANQREQFGKPIGQFQLIQEKLVDMATKIENMRNFVYKAAWMEDNGIPVNTMAAMCKRYCARASFEVVNDAMQIFGGIGYSSDLRIARVWRNNRICGIGGGTEEIMVHVAGRALLKQYKDFQAL